MLRKPEKQTKVSPDNMTDRGQDQGGQSERLVRRQFRFRATDVFVSLAVALALIASYLILVIVLALVIASILTFTEGGTASGTFAYVFASIPAFLASWMSGYIALKLLNKVAKQEFLGETYGYFVILAVVFLALYMRLVTRVFAPEVLTVNYILSITMLAVAYILARLIVVRRHKGHYIEVAVKERRELRVAIPRRIPTHIKTPAHEEEAQKQMAPEVLVKVKKFDALRRKGIITDEEFEAKKKQLLGE